MKSQIAGEQTFEQLRIAAQDRVVRQTSYDAYNN
jgi:hypothetical protein